MAEKIKQGLGKPVRWSSLLKSLALILLVLTLVTAMIFFLWVMSV